MRATELKHRHTHSGPTPVEYVVTQFPGAFSATSPAPAGTFSANATNNNIRANDTVLTQATMTSGNTNTLYTKTYGFDAIIPSDAVISKVEVVVRNKYDAVSAHPRPGVITRVSGTLSAASWHEQTESNISTSLVDFTWDVTADPTGSGWASATWTRDLLLDAVFMVGIRARDTDNLVSVCSWDSVSVRVTYTGAPPGVPVANIYTLSVGTAGDGAGTITGAGIDTGASDTTQSYPDGSQVRLTATPATGSVFSDWEGDASGTSPTYTVDMNADKLVTARFAGQPALDELALHTGSVLQQDLITVDNPIPLWKQVNDPYHYGPQTAALPPGQDYVPANDTYIFRQTTSGDSHQPIGGSVSNNWRRHVTVPGTQSLFDAGVPNSSTRSQLIINSRTSTFWLSRQSDHNWTIFSHRRHGQTVLPQNFNPSSPFAAGKSIMVCQWKTFKEGSGQDPILHIDEWKDGYQLVYNDKLGSNRQSVGFIPAANNTWVRFRFECLWSTNSAQARFTLWGDVSGGAEVALIGPITSGHRTLYPNTAGPVADFSVGPYGDLNTATSTYNSDFANIQVCSYI